MNIKDKVERVCPNGHAVIALFTKQKHSSTIQRRQKCHCGAVWYVNKRGFPATQAQLA